MKNTLNFLLTHNAAESAIVALVMALVTFAVLLFARNFIARRLRALAATTVTIWDDVLAEIVAATKPLFLISLSVLVGVTQLSLPDKIEALPYKAMVVLLILQVGAWVARAMKTGMTKRLEQSREVGDSAAVTNLGVLAFIAQVTIWLIVLLLLLDNLGINITTLVASLGIGGIAVALALQNILGDLFASLSIAIDKPFLVGDFIIVDDFMGTVRYVGLKTTRLQSLSGEELIFSNGDLLKSRIRNYKRMAERRVVFGFGLTYDTPSQTLQAITAKVRDMVDGLEGARFDRAHFKGFGASSLDFEIVYFLLSPDFNLYMDAQQQLNLELLDYCNANGIQFAFPTQTVHVASMPAMQKTSSSDVSSSEAVGS